MLYHDDCLNIGEATLVKYLGYRVHQQITYRNSFVDSYETIMESDHCSKPLCDGYKTILEYVFKQGMLIDGSRIISHSRFTKEQLLDKLWVGECIDYFLHLDNHDSILYFLHGNWYLLAHGDGEYWLYSLKGFDVEAYNIENFHHKLPVVG